MKCPLCDGKTTVVDTRHTEGATLRVRECIECLTRYPTSEKIVYQKLTPYIYNKIHERIEGRG